MSLSAALQEDEDRARRKQMVALQHRLIEVSSEPEKPVQSVLAWHSSSVAGARDPKAAGATAAEASASLN